MKAIGKITEEIYTKIWERFEQGATMDDLIRTTGYSYSTVYRILKNPTWEVYRESLQKHSKYVMERRLENPSTRSLSAGKG